MSRSRYRGLIALNAGLVGVMALVALPQVASGEQRTRPRGEYTMVSGRAQGIAESAIYVVDSTNQEMIVLRWDRSRKALQGIGYRDLAEDARGGGGRGR